MTSDISLFCRLCAELYPKNTLIKINSGEFINLNLAEKIYQYFIINITENDILPRDICSHCFKKVLETYEFHQLIQRAQGILQTKIEIKHEQITESYDVKSEDDPASYDFMFDPPIMDDSEEDDAPPSKRVTTKTEDDVVKDEPLNIVNDKQTKGSKTKKIRRKKKFGETNENRRRKVKVKVPKEKRPKVPKEKKPKLPREPSLFLCERCGKYYKSGRELKHHLRTHNGEKPFKCDLCLKVYKCPSGLRKHKLGHSGIRPHECTICGLRFPIKWTLDRHVLLHSDEFNYECSFCGKKFKKESYLKIHLRQHTGERPYSCLECNHFFANDSNFIKHLKVRHGLVHVSIVNRHQYPFPPENNN